MDADALFLYMWKEQHIQPCVPLFLVTILVGKTHDGRALPTGDSSFETFHDLWKNSEFFLFSRSSIKTAEPTGAEKVDVVIIFSKNCVVAYQWIAYLTGILGKIFSSSDRPPTR